MKFWKIIVNLYLKSKIFLIPGYLCMRKVSIVNSLFEESFDMLKDVELVFRGITSHCIKSIIYTWYVNDRKDLDNELNRRLEVDLRQIEVAQTSDWVS